VNLVSVLINLMFKQGGSPDADIMQERLKISAPPASSVPNNFIYIFFCIL